VLGSVQIPLTSAAFPVPTPETPMTAASANLTIAPLSHRVRATFRLQARLHLEGRNAPYSVRGVVM